jgi:hypothetical protein
MAANKSCILTVDRVENGIVIMTDEKEAIFRATPDMLGLTPRDGDVLHVLLDDEGMIRSAAIDDAATAARRAAMRAKLSALFG